MHSVSLNYNKPLQPVVLQEQSVSIMFACVMNEIRSAHADTDGPKLGIQLIT